MRVRLNNLRQVLFLLIASWLLGQVAQAQDQAYWVWQRTDPLSNEEAKQLGLSGVTELYWHAGTISWDGAAWRWRERLSLDWAAIRSACPAIQVTPVLRIEPSGSSTFPTASRAPLRKVLEKLLADAASNKIQIDYESPDRLITEYAGFLHELKDQGRSWRLSISALAHWSKFGGQLAGSADEITPMFYDLDPKSEHLGAGGMPPLIDPGISAQLESWHGFPIPWKAGLPNFSRVTVLDQRGKSRGNLRGWTWDDIFFASFLQPCRPTAESQTLFTVIGEANLGFTPLHTGESLDVRYPDREQLRNLEHESRTAGAQGVVYFRLADSGDPSGFSPRDIGSKLDGPPGFTLARDDSGRFVLSNTGTHDLMPAVRGAGPEDRGYALELEASVPLWREAVAGDFAKTSAARPGTAAGLETQHLQFWFSHLASGTHLTSGYIDEVDHPKTVSIRWRIRNLSKEDSWHQIN